MRVDYAVGPVITVVGLSLNAFAQTAPSPSPVGGQESAVPASPSIPSGPLESPGAAKPPEAPTPTTDAPEAPKPTDLAVGKEGLFRPGLLLQTWFVLDRQDSQSNSAFRIRRAEIHAKGEIVPKLVGYGVMVDPARALEFQDRTVDVQNQQPAPAPDGKPEQVTVAQPGVPFGSTKPGPATILQDVFVTLQSDYVDASMGQFKTPVSWEGYNSSSKLMFPERAYVARQFGDKRDIGIRLAKSFEYFGYSAGLFNGAGQNLSDNNKAKDGALRVEAYPIPGLTVAGVAYGTLWQRSQALAKDRYEADVRLELGPFLVQGELIRARDKDAKAVTTNGQGAYGAMGFKTPIDLQPVVRVGYFDPDVKKDNDRIMHYEFGVNYLLRKNEAKLQAAYSHFRYQDSAKKPLGQFVFAAQVGF